MTCTLLGVDLRALELPLRGKIVLPDGIPALPERLFILGSNRRLSFSHVPAAPGVFPGVDKEPQEDSAARAQNAGTAQKEKAGP